ncbi:MAG TPA: tetratricopeptide repeat protein [Planctomycetota bacterium]|nr:tetratricopeptide repeat protein [Planctomycetota bacterium]
MKTPKILLSALLLVAAACSSGPDQNGGADAAPKPDGAPKEGAAPAGEAHEGQEWDALHRKLVGQSRVDEQEKAAQSEEHYRLALRYYDAGDFEKAEAECAKALSLNEKHAASHALMIEVQFALGKGRVTPQSLEFEAIIQMAAAKQQQVIFEIREAMDNGIRSYNLGNYDDAERHFRTILEYAKWLPTGVELERQRQHAAELLERTKLARHQKKIDEDKARQAIIEDQRAREEVRRKLDQRRELELLFSQAQIHFEKEQYGKCIDVCERILYIDPKLSSVDEMKMIAQRLNHVKADRDTTRSYIEQWKRTFENIELLGTVQAEELTFPARELWLEVIRRRKPKGILGTDEGAMSEADTEVINKIRTIQINLDFQNADIRAVIDYIREISGLNIVIDTRQIADPSTYTYPTLRLKDVTISAVFDIVLGGKELAYSVESGIIVITTAKAVKSKVQLDMYNVQDITYGLQDFPGVNITLSEDALGASTQAEEGAKPVFDGEALANLIKATIEKSNWDEANGQSCVFQNGLLIVRNSIDVHRKVRKFLNDLRSSTGILVAVESRFLTVEDNFLQQVGMDFRDVDGARVAGVLSLDDINPAFSTLPGSQFSTFIDPDGGGGPLAVSSPGITGTFGDNIVRNMGARIQNIMVNDSVLQRFYQSAISPLGGMSLQYTLLDDISLEAIVRLVSRSTRQHQLVAPKLTLFNTQRGNIRIANQFAYIKDYDIQVAVAAAAADPIPSVVTDGISLDVRPIVSADRRFVTIELRPTVATLFPLPPQVFGINISVAIPGNVVTPTLTLLVETPILNVQSLRTTVIIPDRGTLLIGGLTVYFEEDAQSSIPLWRNIPILGNLGSEKVKGRQRRQLLILLRAKIIIPDEEERRRFD